MLPFLLPALALQVEQPRLLIPERPSLMLERPPLLLPGDDGFDEELALAPIAALRLRNAATPGEGFSFNGTTSGLEKSTSVISAYPLSFAAWIKPDAGLANTASFAIGGVGAATARLSLVDNSSSAGVNHIDAQTVNAAGTTVAATGTTNWTAGAWQLVVAVWTASNNRDVYFNGSLEAHNTGANTSDPTTYTKTVVGGRYVGGTFGGRFTGIMAYMTMWSSALAGSDVTALWNGGAGALPTTVQGGSIIFRPVWSGSSVIDAVTSTTLTSTGVTKSTDVPF